MNAPKQSARTTLHILISATEQQHSGAALVKGEDTYSKLGALEAAIGCIKDFFVILLRSYSTRCDIKNSFEIKCSCGHCPKEDKPFPWKDEWDFQHVRQQVAEQLKQLEINAGVDTAKPIKPIKFFKESSVSSSKKKQEKVVGKGENERPSLNEQARAIDDCFGQANQETREALQNAIKTDITGIKTYDQFLRYVKIPLKSGPSEMCDWLIRSMSNAKRRDYIRYKPKSPEELKPKVKEALQQPLPQRGNGRRVNYTPRTQAPRAPTRAAAPAARGIATSNAFALLDDDDN